MTLRIGVDIGGTFTDFALVRDGAWAYEKVLSTPADRSLAVLEGLERLASREGRPLREFLGDVDSIIHGTTVADNTMIEMNGAVTGLLTTEGFRDELELRRGAKEDIWDVRLLPPEPIVPRRRRLTVPERLLSDGSVHTPLDEAAARAAIRRLGQQGVESIAISTLFSFINPVHEEKLAAWVREELPEVDLSVSHRVMPKAPEFERTSTTVVNAYVGPRVTTYLDRLTERLHDAGYEKELLVMQSSGGVMTRDYLRESPVRVLASGPAGGVIGSAHVGVAKGLPDLLCVDMGGTSYDVSVVRGGVAPAEPGWNWHHRYVIGLPMVSVETLGAGGGSICQVESGVLRVGPESAGADPGPVCYGRGGDRPTITDANLVLGLLCEDSEFAGGSFQLTRKGVEEAFQRFVAEPKGYDVEAAAFDCWRVVNANMTQAVRRLTAEKGTDPQDLAMLAYGGNGPVFAAIQAQELGISRVLVPRASPTFSALGALVARSSIDEERSHLASAGSVDVERLRLLWQELDSRADQFFAAAGFSVPQRTRRFQVNLRYPGQNWSLPVEVATLPGGVELDLGDRDLRERWIEAFHESHRLEYGHARLEEEPEVTGVRLFASVALEVPGFEGGAAEERPAPKPHGTRRANLGMGFAPTSIYRGADLLPGHRVDAPAIIEETFTNIVVYPGWQAVIDRAGDCILQRSS